MNKIARHIHLERRRLTIIGFFAFAAGYCLYSHIDVVRMGLPIPVIGGLLYMTLIVLAAAATTYFLPGLRRVADMVAVTRLGFAIWVATTQNYEIAASPFLSATIVVGGAVLAIQAGGAVQKLSQKLALPERAMLAISNTREFLSWLDNVPEYQAAALQPAFNLNLSRTQS